MRCTGMDRLVMTLCVTGLCLAATGATPIARAASTQDLVGTWALVRSVTEKDGLRREQFGANAMGMMSFDGMGHFMLTIIGADIPRFASGDRAQPTAEESKAVVARTISMIGRYAVDASDNTLTFHVEASSFPNWTGTTQKRVIVLVNADALEYVTPTASSGGVGTVTWRRLR